MAQRSNVTGVQRGRAGRQAGRQARQEPSQVLLLMGSILVIRWISIAESMVTEMHFGGVLRIEVCFMVCLFHAHWAN
jgi:hypothetical protein